MRSYLRSLALCAALTASFAPASAQAQAPAAGAPAAASSGSGARPRDDLKSESGAAEWGEAGPSESLVGAILRMLLVLALVLALAYLTLNFGLRRLMRLAPPEKGLVRVHERVPLEAKKSVYLVEAAGEYLLLGVGEGEVSLLARLEAERTRQWLERRSSGASAAPRPFWERLTVKPKTKPPDSGQAPPAA